MPFLLKNIGRSIKVNGFCKLGVALLSVSVLIPVGVYSYSKSIDWCPVRRPISLHPGTIDQTFHVNYTARYFAEIELQTVAMSPDTVQCLTGITGFSPKPKCSEKPILNFGWQLLQDGKTVSSGRYEQDKSGRSMSASTVGVGITDFDAKRGDTYTLIVKIDPDATRLDVTNPTLDIDVNSANLEFALMLEGLSRVSAVALGLVGLTCLIWGIKQQRVPSFE
ncbi:MAG TPA: hypothetical protein VK699_20385 [Terriglobales bacterium]|jgi:hypothetical protein|nr:hypothetical protein [Terriglobales bacterium]